MNTKPMSAEEVLASLHKEIEHAGCLGPKASEARANRLRKVEAAVAAMAEREAALAARVTQLEERDMMLTKQIVLYAAEGDALRAKVEALRADRDRLNSVRDESWDLRCFNIPTPGGDDADIGWRVVEHHSVSPHERVIAIVYHDDPRAAIDAARAEARDV